MLEEKDTYSIQDLFDNLDISIRQLQQVSRINEVTLARIRDGKSTYRSTANKLLKAFSGIYDRPFYLSRVTGINIQMRRQRREKERKEPTGSAA